MPWARHLIDRNIDQSRTAGGDCRRDQVLKRIGRIGACMPNTECRRERTEIRIVQLVAKRFAELLQLERPHVSETAVVEHNDRDVQAISRNGRQFLKTPAKAAVARDGDDRPATGANRRAERGGESVAKRALISGIDVSPRLEHREVTSRYVPDLGQLV